MESGFGELGDVNLVRAKLPKKLKKRRQIDIEDGPAAYVLLLYICLFLMCLIFFNVCRQKAVGETENFRMVESLHVGFTLQKEWILPKLFAYMAKLSLFLVCIPLCNLISHHSQFISTWISKLLQGITLFCTVCDDGSKFLQVRGVYRLSFSRGNTNHQPQDLGSCL